VKRTVVDKEIESRLSEGSWTLKGCLGDDPLGIDRIEVDCARLDEFGLELDELGRELECLWQAGAQRLGAPSEVQKDVRVVVEEAKGRMPCPFGHPGTFSKGVMSIQMGDKQLRFSPLSIHMLREHGFLGGWGSAYRVEPSDLARLASLLKQDQQNQNSQD